MKSLSDIWPSRTQIIKEKVGKLDIIKIKRNWKRLQNYISDKGLVSSIYKELWQLNNKKYNFKMVEGSEETVLPRHTNSQ